MTTSTKRVGFVLQHRDRQVLTELARYGCLTSAQIGDLVFSGVSAQVARRRLLKMTQARLISRFTLPRGLVPLPDSLTGRPVYRLATAGCSAIDLAVQPRAPTFGTTLHDLLANEILLSLADELGTRTVTPEPELRRGMLQARARDDLPTGMVVPDGALHLDIGTIYLELVRTSVRSGNSSYGRKLAAYLRLSRSGAFHRVFAHERVRAVLTLTTSTSRAVHLAAQAALLPRGKRLFWFGALSPEGELPTAWRSGDGQNLPLAALYSTLAHAHDTHSSSSAKARRR